MIAMEDDSTHLIKDTLAVLTCKVQLGKLLRQHFYEYIIVDINQLSPHHIILMVITVSTSFSTVLL